MGHYVRILSPSEQIPSLERARTALATAKLAGTLNVASGSDEKWTQVSLEHPDGTNIATIARDDSSHDLVAQEIEEFRQEIADCKPESAVAWLNEYLPTVKTIYAFQILRGTNVKNGWEIFGKIKDSIFNQVGGILQADGEGFSEEQGYHILWQFDDSVKGTWWMGVLQDGEWVHFQMNLGNKKQRAAFLRGEVPEGVNAKSQSGNRGRQGRS